MKDPNQNQEQKRVLESDTENERRERFGTQDQGNVTFSSGRDRSRDAQQSDRQGSQKPTQQRPEDR